MPFKGPLDPGRINRNRGPEKYEESKSNCGRQVYRPPSVLSRHRHCLEAIRRLTATFGGEGMTPPGTQFQNQVKHLYPHVLKEIYGVDGSPYLGQLGVLIVDTGGQHVFLTPSEFGEVLDRESRSGYDLRPLLICSAYQQSRRYSNQICFVATDDERFIQVIEMLKAEGHAARGMIAHVLSEFGQLITDEELKVFAETGQTPVWKSPL